MSISTDKAGKQLAVLPDSADYEVGYKKPPKQSQFQKGRSGNPNGRPRGAKNKIPKMGEERLKAIILAEAYRTIPVQDQGSTLTIPIAQAVVRSMAVNAAKGNIRAQRLFTEMLTETEGDRRKQHNALMEAAITYKLEWEREFERCDRHEIPRPEPLPHPDHIIIDIREDTVSFNGPVTKEEKATLDNWVGPRKEFEEKLEYLQQDLEQAKTDRERILIH